MKPIGMDVIGRDASANQANQANQASQASPADPPALVPGRPDVDLDRVAAWRLGRLRDQLQRADAALAILTSPVSLRYAADFRDYALFQSHIPIFYAFVTADGQVVMHGASPVATGRFDEVRPARAVSFFNAGANLDDEARALARDVAGFLADTGASGRRVAVEYVNPSITAALMQAGLDVIDAVGLMDRARSVKSDGEIECMRWALRVAEAGMRRMEAALVPGITENRLWALLHETNIANDGDWIDGRMLCSGHRTNPWLQEAGGKVIEAGELVAFDTDMIGPFGYCADVSRTWLCGDGAATPAQRALYRRAWDEVQHNIALIEPGMSLREVSERGFRQPEIFIPNRYPCLAHGVGMSDEYPKIHYREDWDARGYDGVIEENMVLCVESYVGAAGGAEGVKLEEQVLVTGRGCEVLSGYPFDPRLLAGHG